MSPERKTLDELRINRVESRGFRPSGAIVAVLLSIAVLAAGAYAWFHQPRPAVVRSVVVRQSNSTGDRTLLNASGYVTARREATVSSKVTGKVVEVLVEEGKRVDEGEVLARLDASNVERNLQLAKAQWTSARKALDETRATLTQAERDLQRIQRMAADRAASQSELDQAETDVIASTARLARQHADVTVSECEVAIWQQQLDDTIIRAPFSGIVTSKDAQPGEMVSPVSAGGGFIRTGICTLVDMSSLEIEVDVSESYINRVVADQPVVATLDAYPSWKIPATVIAIVPTADRQKATVRVRVGFDELDERILPQMSVKVAFQDRENDEVKRPLIHVPESAIQQQDGQDIVWVADDDRVERRAVKLGDSQGGQVTIEAGIQPGERVVVAGNEQLIDGERVVEEDQ